MGSYPILIDVNYNAGAVGSHSEGSQFGEMAALSLSSIAAAAWPSANNAIYIPFEVRTTLLAKLIAWRNGTTLSGNVDVGIYDETGVRLVSSGSTAQAGSGTAQYVDITDTTLNPGVYFAAMALDNATGQISQTSLTSNAAKIACGIQQQATAFPLPTTATFATPAVTVVPAISVIVDYTAV